MTDRDEPDIQNSGISNEAETAIQTPTPTEDKTLLLSDALTDKAFDEPTRRFAAPAREQAQTVLQNAPDTEPTRIFPTDETENAGDEPEIEANDEARDGRNENALRPSRVRFALLCLVFVNMFILAGMDIHQASLIQSDQPFDWARQGDGYVITSVKQGFEGAFQVGDEWVSINGIEATPANRGRLWAFSYDKPGTPRAIVVRRDGQLREVETVSVSPPLSFHLTRILQDILLPAMFLITGLLIFLLKPNDKQALLLALLFVSFLNLNSLLFLFSENSSPVLLVVIVIGLLIDALTGALFLHFCLVFPERSTLLRRFPKLERLIYLPVLLFVLPDSVLNVLQATAYSGLTAFSARTLLYYVAGFTYPLYFLAGLLVLIFTYRQSSEIARRKLRVILVGLLCAFLPALLTIFVISPLLWAFEMRNFLGQVWMGIIIVAPFLLIPPVFAYAIVRHRVIPVSFVVRRGLQYLLAKNALRFLLILPVLGIVWNIAANPNRTVSEILFQNSFAFYLFIAVAIIDGVLMRSRLNEWIDRRFFREQYNQERLLHELIEDVKESDSMPKLSRLVSSRIQSALHPTSVYLFYRDDEHNSDFSLGYTMSEPPAVAGGSTQAVQSAKKNSNVMDAKPQPPATAGGSDKRPATAGYTDSLAADSPLLRFMQTKRGAVEFSLSGDEGLPRRERDWLRSIDANLLVPVHGTDGKLAGFFSLGEKMSQIPYTSRDKELLETLAHQIALVQENLGLKDRVRREQKIKTEVLSRFDEGNINLLKECPKCGRCFDRDTERCSDDGAELTFTLPVERNVENRYRLEKLLGKGGMGAVYEATDTRINRTVAVKILSGAMFGNKEALRRFEREAQTAGRLQHPNIVTVFDYGVLTTEGAFLVMEIVRGLSLREILDREEKLNAETVVAWFGQVLDGVEAAHKQGVIHRDLKPDNILVSQSENGAARLCILDFGLARLNEHEITGSVTVPGTVMGTFGYMPPEQLRGERTDERSDLFAVGVMIYEALRGEKPFRGNGYHELLRAMTSDEFLHELDGRLTEFFKQSLAQEPAARFASAGEMKRVLSISAFATR